MTNEDTRCTVANEQGDPSPRRGCASLQAAAYEVACTGRGEVRVMTGGTAATLASHTFVNDLPIASAFGDVVPPACADLVDVAVAVYVSDRLCRRHPSSAPRSEPLWQRRMHLEIPVREPERWNEGGVGKALVDLLTFLTDDSWTFTFAQRGSEASRPSEAQRGLFREPPVPPASAALFSGGLDSLAGLVTRLARHPDETVVVFSGRTNKRIGAPQRTLLEAVAREFPQRVRPVAVRFGLDRRSRGAFDQEETSQRTRGFVFQAFGAVTAHMAGLDRLDVYENGVGATNLPYTDAQLGSQATRATHPVSLQLVSALLTHVFDSPFGVALPYAFVTKGELCVGLRDAGLGSLASLSVSCDGFPQRRKRAAQCGVCPSCLLRRQSLHHARLLDDDPSGLYLHNIYDAPAGDSWERRFALRAMGGQVHHLSRALAAERPWEALTNRYPDLEDVADALTNHADGGNARESLVALYGRYCREWGAFAMSTMGRRDAAPAGNPTLDGAVASSRSLVREDAVPAGATLASTCARLGAPDLWLAADDGGPGEQ